MRIMETTEKIFSYYEQHQSDKQRTHLGASQIGHPCERKIWYDFRLVKKPKFDGKTLRIFKTGDLEEWRVLNDLTNIGITFKVPENVKQHRFVDEKNVWFSGCVDGIGIGFPENRCVWHIIEIKSANNANFKKIRENGVIAAKPEHYAQMQCYMGWSGIKNAAYIVVNKNSDDILIEFVDFDPDVFSKLRERATRIVSASKPPELSSGVPSWLWCRYCQYIDICSHNEKPEKNCRTCIHWCCTTGGSRCALENTPTSVGYCEDYRVIPELVVE